jgi:hypothetical protein
VFTYSAPLYCRANANLYLRPLHYTDLLDLFPDRTPEERLAIYAITGGIPAYLTYFAQTPDIRTAVERLCFAPDSPYLSDMETLFDERLDEPSLDRAILSAVSNGNSDPVSLSQQLGIPFADLERRLFFLGLMKLIEARHSVHDDGLRRRVRYALAEPALSFYCQNLKPTLGEQVSQKEMVGTTETIVSAYAILCQSLGGEPFLAFCREWIWAAAKTERLGMSPDRVGAYWDDLGQTPDFSIAVADSREKKLLVGAVLWENGVVPTAILEEIVHNSQQLPQVQAEGWSVEQIIFGRRPFAVEIWTAAAASGIRLMTLAEMEPLLLTARSQKRWELDNPQPVEIEF